MLLSLDKPKEGSHHLDATIIKAHILACWWHKGETRKSGEGYIQHPIRVAKILSDHGYGSSENICKALLHDAVEHARDEQEAQKRMRIIRHNFTTHTSNGVYNLSDNMGVSPQLSRHKKRELYLKRIIDGPITDQRVKTSDYLDNSKNMSIYHPATIDRRIGEAREVIIPMAQKAAPSMAKELEELIEQAEHKNNKTYFV